MKNSILFNFTKRSLSANKTRTAVSIVGVVLSTALICGVFTTVTSLHAAMLKRTIAYEGSWSAMSQNVDPKKVDELVASQHTKTAASSTVLSSTRLSGDTYTRSDNGTFQIRTLPQQLKGTADAARGLTITPTITEGSYPSQTNEVVLPERYKDVKFTDPNLWSDEKIGVGSTIYVKPTNSTGADSSHANDDSDSDTNSTQTQSYTVSGFYETSTAFYGNSLVAGDNILVALASSQSANYATQGKGMVWFEMTDFSTQDEVTDFVQNILGPSTGTNTNGASNNESSTSLEDPNDVTRTIFHTNLMKYQGLRGQSSNWDALWNFGLFLAVLISIASIVLIYNFFAISVAERTRQFGLLSSLGASKKQMWRCVYLESLLIGIIGIPLGIVFGICGVALTLQLTKQGFTALLNYGTNQTVSLHVNGFALALAAIFELLVLLIGAAVPAARASRQSPISAIRQTADIKMSKRRVRKLSSKAHGWYAHFAGVAGMLSSRNLSRKSSRGTTIVVSLAISVALIVITGNFIRTIVPLINVQNSYSDADLSLSLYSSKDYTALESAKIVERVESGIAGLTRQESEIDFQASAAIDGSSLTQSMRSYLSDSPENFRSTPQGYTNYDKQSNVFVAPLSIRVPSQASWNKLAEKYKVDKTNGALVQNSLVAFIDENQQMIEPFDSPTTMELYSWSRERSLPLLLDSAGRMVTPIYPDEQQASANGSDTNTGSGVNTSSHTSKTTDQPSYVTLDTLSNEISVTKLTSIAKVQNIKTEAPYLPQGSGSDLVMYLAPELGKKLMPANDNTMMHLFYTAQNSAEAAEKLRDALRDAGLKSNAYELADLSTNRRNAQLVTQTLLLFLVLFTAIMVLIAIANVFNTLCNSILLRTREFAVLHSIGMDEKQFKRMIVCECLSYALRGLAIGAVISLGACWIFWKSVIAEVHMSALSSNFATFKVPVSLLLDASVCVIVVLILSVVYALRKTRATSVVEVLRNEVI